jgi:predicted nuclease of predicted toxin-antitoxin system
MVRFLVDEDLPRSLAPRLRATGMLAEDVRDAGLRGRPDEEIFRHAILHGFVIVTADLGFGNQLRFPVGAHRGIVVARFPNEVSTTTMNEVIAEGLRGLSQEEIVGALIVIEPGRIRVRRSN